MKARQKQIYAIYRGELNLGDGTAEELAKKLNISEKSIRTKATPKFIQQDKNNKRLIVIKLGKEEIAQ
ncbi:hypothetical protein [Volucribacter amazonae]|uniref:Uncharacterized protein n=1 Tax=Volucribacter amazonae TaxID=256731 RepID=A0A9X4P9D8_9PAST|nr:hypothetical protein [Volucribacter amazonae]MDG6895070.1 hypothetical protein [Volucribacter amazonae]